MVPRTLSNSVQMVAYIRRNGGITTMSWEQLITRIRRSPGRSNPLDEVNNPELPLQMSKTVEAAMPLPSALLDTSFKMPAAPRFFCRDSELADIAARLRNAPPHPGPKVSLSLSLSLSLCAAACVIDGERLIGIVGFYHMQVISLYGPGGIGMRPSQCHCQGTLADRVCARALNSGKTTCARKLAECISNGLQIGNTDELSLPVDIATSRVGNSRLRQSGSLAVAPTATATSSSSSSSSPSAPAKAANLWSNYSNHFCIPLHGGSSTPILPYDAMLFTIRAFHLDVPIKSINRMEVEGYYLSCFKSRKCILLLGTERVSVSVSGLLDRA